MNSNLEELIKELVKENSKAQKEKQIQEGFFGNIKNFLGNLFKTEKTIQQYEKEYLAVPTEQYIDKIVVSIDPLTKKFMVLGAKNMPITQELTKVQQSFSENKQFGQALANYCLFYYNAAKTETAKRKQIKR